MNHGITTFQLRKLAYQFAAANKLKTPTKWTESCQAGKDWVLAFLKRHPRLSVRKPEATSLARATSFNKHTVSEFFNNYKELQAKHKFAASRIYNMDETALTTVHVPPKVISEKNVKQVAQVTSAERGILVTGICCVSASGIAIPPTFVWPRKTDRQTKFYMKDTLPGSLGLYHASGWMTEDNFSAWMEHFIQHTKPTPADPVLLLLDNHQSHLAVQAINRAKECGVIMLTFPPHTTNKLQPLDVSIYGPLKTYYNAACNDWQLTNPGKTIGLYDVGELSAKAMLRAVTPENIMAGYKKTGIYPMDVNIFQDADFLPAYVTDRPTVDDNEGPSTSGVTLPISQEPALELPPDNTEITPSTSSFIELSRKHVSPSDIQPYPKAQPRQQTSKGRKRSKSAVLTATPMKQMIESEVAARKAKKTKIKRKLVAAEQEPETEDEEEPELLSDTDSPDETESESGCTELDVGSFVVVRYARKNRHLYYVARVEAVNEDAVDVTFYKRSGDGFILPENEDSDTVDRSDIDRVLPEPRSVGGTARVALKLRFDSNLDDIAQS